MGQRSERRFPSLSKPFRDAGSSPEGFRLGSAPKRSSSHLHQLKLKKDDLGSPRNISLKRSMRRRRVFHLPTADQIRSTLRTRSSPLDQSAFDIPFRDISLATLYLPAPSCRRKSAGRSTGKSLPARFFRQEFALAFTVSRPAAQPRHHARKRQSPESC